jgi:glucose/arabinose dehydrogenase
VRRSLTAVLALLLAGALAACGDADAPAAPQVGGATTPSPTWGPPEQPGYRIAVNGVGVKDAVASGLGAPTAIAFLPDGSALVAERDSARILRVTDNAGVSLAGTVPDVDTDGGGGLLGLAIPPPKVGGDRTSVYAYYTSGGENRVARMPYENGRVGPPETLLDGIPAGAHNGGAMAVGPDGTLYVGTGDDASQAQDAESLGGKILRLDLDGSVPADNPDPGSPVWTSGHRDVTGLAFDERGRLWATETGQTRYQELNRIRRGKNYGWPLAEGQSADTRFVRAYHRFSEALDESSPQGLAIADGVAYVADLRNGKLWSVPLGDGDSTEYGSMFGGIYGPLRALALSPAGELWLGTSDGAPDVRGTAPPSGRGDSLLRITLRR